MYTDKPFTIYTLKTIWSHVMWYFLVQSLTLHIFIFACTYSSTDKAEEIKAVHRTRRKTCGRWGERPNLNSQIIYFVWTLWECRPSGLWDGHTMYPCDLNPPPPTTTTSYSMDTTKCCRLCDHDVTRVCLSLLCVQRATFPDDSWAEQENSRQQQILQWEWVLITSLSRSWNPSKKCPFSKCISVDC